MAQTVGGEMLPTTSAPPPGPHLAALQRPGCDMKRGAGQHGEGMGEPGKRRQRLLRPTPCLWVRGTHSSVPLMGRPGCCLL